MTDPSISFVDPDVQKCPFPHYAQVRARQPVYRDPVTGFYVLTTYDAVRKATADVANLSSRAGQIGIREGSTVADEVRALYQAEGWMPVHSLVNNDPPDHQRFRSFVERAFSPAQLKTIEPRIAAAVDRLVGSIASQGEMEFMRGFAFVLPLLVFGAEFGVPEEDQDRWRHWAAVLLAQMDPVLSPEREMALTRDVCALQQYLMTRIAHYRANPEPVLLSDLVRAADEGRMTTPELLSVIQMLVPAGHETTANALGSGMLRLARDPALQQTLRDNPAAISAFVDETLRLDAPVQGLFRIARRDLEIEGVAIPEGSTVVLSWGAANRDGAQFAEPDTVKLDRKNGRQHLSFGVGTHFCVGSLLAKAELRIAFQTILRHLGDIRLADRGDAVSYRPHFFAYGPAELWIAFRATEPDGRIG